LLTQNLHLTPSTQQAEQASFTREKIPRRARQFFLKINKKDKVVKFQSLELAGWYQTVPYLRLEKPCEMTYSCRELSASKLETIRELQSAKNHIAERMT
jgi:hypothetical protein